MNKIILLHDPTLRSANEEEAAQGAARGGQGVPSEAALVAPTRDAMCHAILRSTCVFGSCHVSV